MRMLILKPIAGLCLMTAVAAYADDTEKPIPQDATKREAKDRGALAWSQRTITEPFEKLAKKDPRWNAKAKAFITLAARIFSGPVGMDVSAEDAYKAGKEVVDAGCDDPLVLYIYTRLCGGPHYPGDDEYERRMVASAAGMEKSHYPPIRRATVLIRTAALKARHRDDPAAQIEAKRLLAAGLELLPESVKVDGTGPEAWQTWSDLVFEAFHSWKALGEDSKGAFDKVDEALAKEPAVKAMRLKVRGGFYKTFAWESRGNGYANTVTEEAFRKFQERLEEAKKALEASWEARPGDSDTATVMLDVELGMGEGDRDRMERWFRRAMEADPDNKKACTAKLKWLEPKWHGSPEAMLAFGKACRDTKNWRSGIPLILPEAHYAITRYMKTEEQLKYHKSKPVYDDVYDVYTEYLKNVLDDSAARTDFAAMSYLSARKAVAHEQFEILGERIVPSKRFSESWLKQIREDCAKHANRKAAEK